MKNTVSDTHVYATGDVDSHGKVNSVADAPGTAPDGLYPVFFKSYHESVVQEAGPNTKYEEITAEAGIDNTLGENGNIDIEVKRFMLSQNGSAFGEGGVTSSQHVDESKGKLYIACVSFYY